MFRTLARLLNDPTLTSLGAGYSTRVFEIHPYQLSQWLEEAWTFSRAVAQWLGLPGPSGHPPFLGDQNIINALEIPDQPDPVLTDGFLRSGIGYEFPGPPHVPPFGPAVIPGFSEHGFQAPGQAITTVGLPWDHAAYAMIIESTGVYEILAEVTRRYMVGETLEPPSLATERWLRSTEELFFRDPPLFRITGIASQFRPDMRVTRRNLYWRLLGMDLPHPLPHGHQAPGGDQPWKRDVGIANVRFRELWVELLRQLWIGYENVNNTSGTNPTDPAYIAEICRYLKDLLVMRRLNGQLAREEFVAVSWLSWFHLTVESDTPLVTDLRAQGTDPYDRLVKIGERVGMKPSPRGWELFQMADLVSTFLRFIELGQFDSAAHAETLYKGSTALQRDVIRIIDLWEMATTDHIKDQGVRTATGADRPQQHALPAHSLSAGANGHRPVTGSVVH
jgi:hypothetical protein